MSDLSTAGLQRILGLYQIEVAVLTDAGAILLVNSAFSKSFGWDSVELAGRALHDIVQPLPPVATDLLALLLQGRTDDLAALLTTADGGKRAVRVRSDVVVRRSGERICAVTFACDDAEAGSGARGAPAATAQPVPVQQIQSALAYAQERNAGVISAGRLQLLGLQDIRVALGDSWHRLSERVHAAAESIIKRHLSPEDAFYKNGECEFVVLFPTLSETEAAFKAESIAKEVSSSLLGTIEHDDLADVTAEHLASAAAMSADVSEIQVRDLDLSAADSLVDALVHTIDQKRAQRQENAARLWQEIRSASRYQLRKVYARHARVAPLQVADFDDTTSLRIRKLMRCQDDEADTMAEIDLRLLGLVAAYLADDAAATSPTQLVKVSMSTLANRSWRMRYLTVVKALGPRGRSALAFQVAASAADRKIWTALGALDECVGALQTCCRFVAVNATVSTIRDLCGLTRPALFVLEESDVASWMCLDPARVKKIFTVAHASGKRVMIDGVADFSGVQLWPRTGADLVGSRQGGVAVPIAAREHGSPTT